MTPLARPLALLLTLLALATGGCGSQTTGDDSPQAGPSSTTTPSTGVTSVTVQQSGGIAGSERTWRVREGTRGAHDVFAAAENGRLRDVVVKPSEVCCDFFSYDITITYSDGDTVRLRAVDGTRNDPAVASLLEAVLRTAPAGSIR